MKTELRLFVSSLVLLLFSPCVARSAEAIEPFIDEHTILVARLDLDRIDWNATSQWITLAARSVVANAPKDGNLNDREERSIARRESLQIRQWAEQFREAGGKSLYAVVNFADVGSTSFLMTPVEQGADVKTLTTSLLVHAGDQARSAVIGNALFAGDELAIKSLAQFKPAARPELARAFAEASDAPIRIALIPSADARKVMEALLPPDVGGVRIEGLAHSLQWALVAIKLPPAPFLHVQLQASDAGGATLLADIWRKAVAAIRQQRVQEQVALPELLAAIAAPEVHQDKVMIALEGDTLTKTADQIAAPFIAARDKTAIVRSVSNERQLLLGCLMYANARKGGPFPDTFEELIKDQDLSRELLINPRDSTKTPGYLYIKPPPESEMKSVVAGSRMIIYEAHDPGAERIAVGYADGHAEIVNEQTFKKLLDEATAKPAK